jgi:predicted metal-binding membrane protein
VSAGITNQSRDMSGARLVRPAAFAVIALAAGLGWAFLMAAAMGLAADVGSDAAGPGMAWLIDWLGALPGAFAQTLYLSLCAPAKLAAGNGALNAALLLPMWLIMVFAMMLPTALPMIDTYQGIADTARAQDKTVQPWGLLVLGYLAVWAAYCLIAAILQWRLTEWNFVTPGLRLGQPLAAAAVLGFAGIYQFSGVKQACLVKCRTPLPYFLAHWSNRPLGVVKMAAGHALYCLACCWALMAVMFSAGLMNVVWMAALTIVMLLEKTLPRPQAVTRWTGAILIIWGLGIAVQALP